MDVSEAPIEQSRLLGTRRGLTNVRWYEYAFLALGIVAALVTDSLTVVRLVKLGSLEDPDFAYGILLLVHSIFLLAFLITGIFYQRMTDIVAFFVSEVMLTIYVVAHYFARRRTSNDTQPKLRLIRLIFTVVFNLCFVPLAIAVIKDYRREEFSKRLFGAFPTARLPLKLYNIFACVTRISAMLSISTLLLNLYNYTGYEAIDRVLLIVGIPLALVWLGLGIGMIRLESFVLAILFYLLSLFQIGFLGYCLYTAIQYSSSISRQSTNTTVAPVVNLVPILNVLYVCTSSNVLAHLLSMIFGVCCTRHFNKGLKEKVFNNPLDLWFQARWFRS